MKATPLRDRFEEKYIPEPNSGCWLWLASDRAGYGQISVGRKMKLAHRTSWELYCGEIPVGLHVLHSCDNPFCVNPDHLFVGTHKDNMADCTAKKRNNKPRGESNHKAKLTTDQVLEIKNSSEQNIILAQRFGVTGGMIGHIKLGRSWRHLS